MLLSPKIDQTDPAFAAKAANEEVNGLQFDLHSQQSANRTKTEAYIAAKFQQAHGTTLTTFLPALLTMSAQESPVAAVGINPGRSGPMYLEQYFDGTVEQKIARLKKQPQTRNQIVEIGNLVVTEPGAGPLLFMVLAVALYQAGFRWMVFTATPEVENIIHKFSFEPYYLADASPACLSDPQEWGSYYDCHPKVLAGDLAQAFALTQSTAILNASVRRFSDSINYIADLLKPCHRLTKLAPRKTGAQ